MNYEAKISSNFKLKEVMCIGKYKNISHDCGLAIINRQLLYCLYLIRRDFGKPIIVESWTRCEEHNQKVGGKVDSYHLNGKAVDIRGKRKKDLDELELLAKRFFLSVKRYQTHLHCDVRGERPCVK